MSDAVERRVLELLDHPTESPYGNPIPALAELGEPGEPDPFLEEGIVALSEVATGDSRTVVVRRIGEPIQTDPQVMHTLRRAGVQPGSSVSVRPGDDGGVLVGSGGEAAELEAAVAMHVFVAKS